MNQLGPIAKILVLIGAINWGLVGIGILIDSDLNLVTMGVGNWPVLEAIIYILVGLSALYWIFNKKA